MSKYSVMYGFVRSRQLEGTFPGDPSTGAWPITALRVMRGWGCPPEAAWPYDGNTNNWPPQEPENIDSIAHAKRLFAYQRVRSCYECKVALSKQIPVIFAAEITDSWFNALDGLIQMANPSDKIIGSHCVLLVGYDDDKGTFTIRNSWGTSWGDKGYGYLPYEFIERFFVECWIALPHEDKPMSLEGEGVITWGIPSFLHSCVHGVEIRGGVGDDYRAWAFAVPYEGFLNVEELFVLPAHRGKGLSNYLFENLERLSEGLSIPLRYWVPFADSTDSNLRIVRHLATTYKYKISPSSVRWASHIMSREVPKGGNKRAFPRPGVIPPDASRLPILAAPFFNFPF